MSAKSPIWHPFTQHGLGEPIPLVNAPRAPRSTPPTGGGSSMPSRRWWVTTHGHNQPAHHGGDRRAGSKARPDHLRRLDPRAGRSAGARPDRAHARRRSTHVFFSDSGSTSVEVALKMALGYWAQSRRGAAPHPGAANTAIMAIRSAAMSVGARGVFNQAYAPLLFDVGTIPFPHRRAANRRRSMRWTRPAARGRAAFIVEPLVLGAGGMLIYPPAVLAEMRAICARHGVLFIADEVMTGWGRTGTLLACEQAGVVPDILCLSKGLTGGAMPLAVTLATAPIFDAHYSSDRAQMFFHSSSYTANPIACAAANANLAIWREEPVLERIAGLADARGGGLRRARRALSGRQLAPARHDHRARYRGRRRRLSLAARAAPARQFPRTRRAAAPARQHGLRHAALLHFRRGSRNGVCGD